jgi:putative membrane protein
MHRATAKALFPLTSLALVAALAGCNPPADARAETKLDDPTIVAIFDAANTYDVETGALAASKGQSQEVRDFGKMLVRDHENVRAQGRALAKSLNVTPSPPKEFALADAHVEAMRSLKNAEGSAFDRAFLQHEVAFHQAVIDAVTTTLLPALQNAQVKDLVTKVAPAFGAHRDAAQNLLNQQK